MRYRKALLLLFSFLTLLSTLALAEDASIRVGWIGAITGPSAKYGAHQAVQVAVDEINASGGINGKKLVLIAEDGKCESKLAVAAAQKLIKFDKVKYILGGHCTPETAPIAPIAERNKVVLLAAITSSPKITNAGDYIFRVTTVSLQLADSLSKFAIENMNASSISILFEETDYAEPVAEHFKKRFKELGGKVDLYESFNPGTTDFRASLSRIKSRKSKFLYLGVQAQDTADLIIKQLNELQLDIQVFGNEMVGNAFAVSSDPDRFEGVIFAEPKFDKDRPKTKSLIKEFKKRYDFDGLPFGIFTAEAYDTPFVLKHAIETCGESPKQVKDCLYKVKNFDGASGQITIDENGDGVRDYLVKRIQNGQKEVIK